MASNFALQNNLRDLWINITTNHVSYLCADKSPDKIKFRDILQSYVKEFLSVVPHRKKFSFSKTEEILRRSVHSEKFNALKAASAWLAISTYANNLYHQPWRKEYHEIKLYSGFYKHHIETSLCGAEVMLELMGYKRVSGNRMILEGSVNLDCLSSTSLDALVAMCECQVLFNVYQEVSKHLPSCTWADVLQYRETYVGSPEQAVRGILSIPTPCHPSECCNDFVFNYTHYQTGCRKCHEMALKIQPPYIPVNGYRNFYPPNSLRYCYSSTDHLPLSNGHYSQVPTAKLIDLDDAFDSSCTPYYRRVNCERWHSGENRCRYGEPYSTTDSNTSLEEEHYRRRERESRKNTDRINSRKSWEYVYQGLENKEKKEHGYRSPSSTQKNRTKVNGGVSEAFGNLKLSPEHSDVGRSHHNDEPDGRKPESLRYSSSKSTDGDRSKHCGSVSPRPTDKDAQKMCASADLESPTWACSKCTYYNLNTRDVCEMCGKSKNVGSEIPLVSGGKHCSRCTLVNKKEARKCEACDANLDGSPTYV